MPRSGDESPVSRLGGLNGSSSEPIVGVDRLDAESRRESWDRGENDPASAGNRPADGEIAAVGGEVEGRHDRDVRVSHVGVNAELPGRVAQEGAPPSGIAAGMPPTGPNHRGDAGGASRQAAVVRYRGPADGGSEGAGLISRPPSSAITGAYERAHATATSKSCCPESSTCCGRHRPASALPRPPPRWRLTRPSRLLRQARPRADLPQAERRGIAVGPARLAQ